MVHSAMAEFRITQAGAPDGDPGIAHLSLVAGAVIKLEVTAPLGGTYLWEIVDAVGSTAVLSATTGLTTSIGDAGSIVALSSFLIQLSATVAGITTTTRRIASVRSNGLRHPVFSEAAPLSYTEASHGEESYDNSPYAPLTGKVAENNWKGWIPWAYEITSILEAAYVASQSTYAPPTLPGLRDQTIFASDGLRVIAGGVLVAEELPEAPSLRIMGRLSPSATSDVELTVWDMGTKATPTLGTLAGTAVLPSSTQPYINYIDQTLSLTAGRRMYELRVELTGGDPGDSFKLLHAGMILSSEEGVTPLTGPVIAQPPFLLGTAETGSTLTALTAPVSGFPSPTSTYRWYAGPEGGPYPEIPGENGVEYEIEPAYAGQVIFFRHFASSIAGLASEDSAFTAVITVP